MKTKFITYWQDETAGIEDMPAKMVLLVVGISCAVGFGWYVWNLLAERTQRASCAENPGPFCIE
ncbi:hypothetical protein [Ileibacterium valens]|uniref:hypothetical protein n=1 Tax=Ileibacterium valens TaxID=1862668 RepID=UPI00257078AD|nr:hypothetical protein [Ileibacterium valens]